jgi:hypothetical protein
MYQSSCGSLLMLPASTALRCSAFIARFCSIEDDASGEADLSGRNCPTVRASSPARRKMTMPGTFLTIEFILENSKQFHRTHASVPVVSYIPAGRVFVNQYGSFFPELPV